MATGTVVDVVMPQMGVSVSEGTITRWMKQVGEHIEADETIVEISTDKVDTEVPSPASGIVREILANDGDTVPVNTRIAVIAVGDAGDADAPADTAPTAATDNAEETPATPETSQTMSSQPAPEPQATNGSNGDEDEDDSGRTFISPVVARMLAEHRLDVNQIPGSGRGRSGSSRRRRSRRRGRRRRLADDGLLGRRRKVRRVVDRRLGLSAARVDERLHVLLGHPATAPTARDLVHVQPMLGQHPRHHRRDERATRVVLVAVAAVGGLWLGGGLRRHRLRRFRGGRSLLGVVGGCRRGRVGGRIGVAGISHGDHRDARVHRHRVAVVGEDLAHDPGRRRRYLRVDLVGRDLDDRLVGLDVVADLLRPAGDGALGHAHAHLRHYDIDDGSCGHGAAPGSNRRRGVRCRPAHRLAGAGTPSREVVRTAPGCPAR